MGGVAALATGICGAAFVAATIFASAELAGTNEEARACLMADYALALTGLFGLAAIPALTAWITPAAFGWISWTRNVALLGCGVLTVLSLWQADYDRLPSGEDIGAATEAMEAGLPEFDPAVTTMVKSLVDRAPTGWLEVAGIGLWIASLSAAALRTGTVPAAWCGIGMAAGGLSFCTSFGAALGDISLQTFGAFSGLFVVPFWFAWSGMLLLMKPHKAATERVLPVAEARPATPPRSRRSAGVRRAAIRLWPS